jgi:hypothetical protein
VVGIAGGRHRGGRDLSPGCAAGAARRDRHHGVGKPGSAPAWRRTASFRSRGLRHVQHEVVVEVILDGPGPAIDESGQLDYEAEDYFGYRWWSATEVADSHELFYPRSLPALLTSFLAGNEIDEPFELWS